MSYGDYDSDEALASGPPACGPLAVVEEAFRHIENNPTRGAVVEAMRGLAENLCRLDALERAAARFAAIDGLKGLGVAAEEARALVAATVPSVQSKNDRPADDRQGRAIELSDPVPWDSAVVGADVLDDAAALVRKYVVLEPAALHAVALWIALTYMLDYAPFAVRLILTSPVRSCGKSLLLAILQTLVRRAVPASSVTPAVLFRVIERDAPTLLLDEIDNAQLHDNTELRALLNSGHSRGSASVMRTVGDDHEPRAFSTWCAIALAGIGDLPDTLASRGVVIRMQRRRSDEPVERLRERRVEAEAGPLCRQLARWAADVGPQLEDADPNLPAALDGRPADNWGVLVGIADLAGGPWPKRARDAAVTLAGLTTVDEPAGIDLLHDLRDVFNDRDTDRLSSEDVASALAIMQDRPWPGWRRGKPITSYGVARLLRHFGVQPRQVRFGTETRKGYLREDLEEAWTRFIPDTESKHPKQDAIDAEDPRVGEAERHSGVSAGTGRLEPREYCSVSVVSNDAAGTDSLLERYGWSPLAAGENTPPDNKNLAPQARKEPRRGGQRPEDEPVEPSTADVRNLRVGTGNE